MALKKALMVAKMKMPAPKKDPMLELDEAELEEETAEAPEMEAAEEEEAGEEEAAADLSEVSDDDLIAELEARGMSVSKAEEAAASSEEE